MLFHYPTFYNFTGIVNFFEDIEDDAAQKNVDELLNWWNLYIILGIYRKTKVLMTVVIAKYSPICLPGVAKVVGVMQCYHRRRGSRMLTRSLLACSPSEIVPKSQIICFFS